MVIFCTDKFYYIITLISTFIKHYYIVYQYIGNLKIMFDNKRLQFPGGLM
jgi:hypothetical protein